MSRDEERVPGSEEQLDELKQEVAEELGLDDDIKKRGWENMTTRETGKIGGNMVKKMVEEQKKDMTRGKQRKK
ncbi:MAG: small, acid-soluble spore protein, alpha/beta type [Bacillota bacterium]|jgi:small acid-soluble spore protein F (minor alpha/beta-type SASP)